MFHIFKVFCKSVSLEAKQIEKLRIQKFLNPHLHAIISLLESTPEFEKTESIVAIKRKMMALEGLLNNIDNAQNKSEFYKMRQEGSMLMEQIRTHIFIYNLTFSRAPYQAQLDFHHHYIMNSKVTNERTPYYQKIEMLYQYNSDTLMQLHSKDFTQSNLLEYLKKRQAELTDILLTYKNPSYQEDIKIQESCSKLECTLSQLTETIHDENTLLGLKFLNTANSDSLMLLDEAIKFHFNKEYIVAPGEFKMCFKV